MYLYTSTLRTVLVLYSASTTLICCGRWKGVQLFHTHVKLGARSVANLVKHAVPCGENGSQIWHEYYFSTSESLIEHSYERWLYLVQYLYSRACFTIRDQRR